VNAQAQSKITAQQNMFGVFFQTHALNSFFFLAKANISKTKIYIFKKTKNDLK